MAKKYILTKDYHTSEDAKAGTVVYLLEKSDFGLAREDTASTDIYHVSVTLKENGDYPSFTYPSNLLLDPGVDEALAIPEPVPDAEKTPLLIGGKVFAGVLNYARPYYGFGTTKDRRTIKGLLGRDHKNRGFDRGSVRTSVVLELIMHEKDIYAITMNSAYRLESMCLQAFMGNSIWRDELILLLAKVGSEMGDYEID